MTNLSLHSIAIIILAAGKGERMGLSGGSKLLLPLGDGQPIIAHTVRAALSWEPVELVVVTRPDQPEVDRAAERAGSSPSYLPVRYVPNARYEQGIATSLAAGIQALGESAQAALVMLGDMPFIQGSIIEALVLAYLREGKPVTIPQYGGAVGPPTLFARQIFPELLHLQGEVGGRQLVARYPDQTCRVPFSEDQRPADIDTEEDYGVMRDA